MLQSLNVMKEGFIENKTTVLIEIFFFQSWAGAAQQNNTLTGTFANNSILTTFLSVGEITLKVAGHRSGIDLFWLY